MNCPYCNYHDSKVLDSRDVGGSIRRRRQCLGCSSRFTTYERPQSATLYVIKKDQRREEFNKGKLLTGIRKACEKRPLPSGAAEKLADDIEAGLFRLGRSEIPASTVGDMVMKGLKELDYIAYIRFASVYREFADITALKDEVDNLVRKAETSQPSNQLPLLPDDELVVAGRRRQRNHR